MAKRKLRIVLRIGPWGFHGGSPISVRFTDQKEDLCRYTRGEGTALQFVLEDADMSSRFAEAIDRGLIDEVELEPFEKVSIDYRSACTELDINVSFTKSEPKVTVKLLK